MRSNPIVRSAAYRFLRRLDSDSCKPYLFLFRYRALLVVQPLIPVHLSKYFGVRSLQILGESNWEVSDCESLYQFGYDCVVVDPHFCHDVELTLLCGFRHTFSGVTRTFGAHGQQTLRGPSPYFITLFLCPPPIHPNSDFAHVYLYHMILNMTLFNQYTSHGVGQGFPTT